MINKKNCFICILFNKNIHSHKYIWLKESDQIEKWGNIVLLHLRRGRINFAENDIPLKI